MTKFRFHADDLRSGCGWGCGSNVIQAATPRWLSLTGHVLIILYLVVFLLIPAVAVIIAGFSNFAGEICSRL